MSKSERFGLFDSLDFISNVGKFCTKFGTSIPYKSRSSSLVNPNGKISALYLIVHCKQCQEILTLFQPGFFLAFYDWGRGWIPPPLENNVTFKLGQ